MTEVTREAAAIQADQKTCPGGSTDPNCKRALLGDAREGATRPRVGDILKTSWYESAVATLLWTHCLVTNFVRVCSHVPQDSKFLKGVNRISLRAPLEAVNAWQGTVEKKKKDKENHV